MRTSALALVAFLGACGPSYVTTGEPNCSSNCGGDTDTGSGSGDDTGSGDTDTDTGSGGGDTDTGSGSAGSQLEITYGTPAGAEIPTMFAHVETIADVASEGDTFGPWGWTGRYAWTSGESVGFNPGLIEAVRFNATFCSSETEDESDASCVNWLAYGTSAEEAHLTATASVVYMGVSYTVSTVTFCWDNTGDGVNDECGSSAYVAF